MKRIIVAILAVMAIMLTSSACSRVSTEPDQSALHYSDGAFSSKKFKDCVDSSTREFNGPGDQHYLYPKGKRTFSFTGAEGSERDPITVTTGSQEVIIPGFVTFTLNTECDSLRKFHETVGLKYGAYAGGGGWASFLSDYIAVPLSSTMNKAAGAIETPEGGNADENWYLLYTNAEAQKQFEDYVVENLPGEIEAALGEEFITVNSVSISKPTVGEALRFSLAAREQARLDNEAQKQKNTTAITQYQTIKDCLATGLDRANCTLIFLNQNGADIPFLPVPQGGAVNFTPQSQPAG